MARGEWRFIAEPYLAAVAISVVSGLSACVFSPSRHTHAPAPALAMASTMASRVRATLAFPVRAARATTSWRLVRAPASRASARSSDRSSSARLHLRRLALRRDRVPFRSRNDPRVPSDVALSPLALRGVFGVLPRRAEVLLQSMRIQWSHG